MGFLSRLFGRGSGDARRGERPDAQQCVCQEREVRLPRSS